MMVVKAAGCGCARRAGARTHLKMHTGLDRKDRLPACRLVRVLLGYDGGVCLGGGST
jgi:hypothetical protein